MTNPQAAPPAPDAWNAAAGLLTRWLEHHERVDTLLGGLPAALGRAGRAHCQHLLFDAVRHLGRLEAALAPLLARPPRAKLKAALLITGGELLDAHAENGEKAEGKTARIIHHAVERTKSFASQAEARLVNAVAAQARRRAGRAGASRRERPGGGAGGLVFPPRMVGAALAHAVRSGEDPRPAGMEPAERPGVRPLARSAAAAAGLAQADRVGALSSRCRPGTGARSRRCSPPASSTCRTRPRASRWGCSRPSRARPCSTCAPRRAARACSLRTRWRWTNHRRK